MYEHVCPHANATCFVRPSNKFCLRCRIQINVDSANNSDANSEKARKERTVLVAQIAALMSSESYDGSSPNDSFTEAALSNSHLGKSCASRA